MNDLPNCRLLFRSAAAFNLAGAALLLALPTNAEVALRMPEAAATSVYGQLALAFIALFAGMYWAVSRDPKTFRPFIPVGMVGKLAVVLIVYANWLNGQIGATLPLLTLGDLAFVIAFWRYLRQSRRVPISGFRKSRQSLIC